MERCGGFEYARTRALGLADQARALADGELEGNGSRSTGEARRALDRAIDYAVRRSS